MAVLALGLGGCGSSPEIDYASIRGLGTAGAPEIAAVFSPGAGPVSAPGWEDSRRDSALGVWANGPRLATDEWLREPRASLSLQRRGRHPTDRRDFLYFETEREGRSVRRGW